MKSQKPFKKRFKKTVIILASAFVLMLALRILYGYMFSDLRSTVYADREEYSSFGETKKNYASEKTSYKESTKTEVAEGNQNIPAEPGADIKYEKTATLKSKSKQFDKDEEAIRGTVKRFKAVIQYEQKTGNKGNRELRLLIGVTPERFDSFYYAAQKIGQIKFDEVIKVDKTNDYRKLVAERKSYEKILTSLNELKSKNGEIKDYIALHDKILEIETTMQDIGVKLGDFNTEEQFCTIKFSLLEKEAEVKSDSFWLRFKIALKWTVVFYTMSICALAGLALAAFLLLLIIDKVSVLIERWTPPKK